ncbi:MAG: agmatinase family protein [Prevotellaceae bacterium]|jgi:agmatinase|nr:agmatinase family protein [Prevotellaceae bacterium]
MSVSFDPNTIGLPNGNYFALPYSIIESDVVLMQVPWDATASYGAGAIKAPEAIIKASTQIDLYDADVKDAWKVKIGTLPLNESIPTSSRRARSITTRVITALEKGVPLIRLVDESMAMNEACEKLNQRVYKVAKRYLDARKVVGVVGGDHSTPFGLLQAVNENCDEFGILHIDAHADLRDAYEGFAYSHASIMYNVLDRLRNMTKIVQVGVRDYCAEEAERMATDKRIVSFTDAALQEASFNGVLWAQQCRDIVAALPEKVYVSFDIDGLTPENCPHTGTPVPGGLTYNQAVFLLKTLAWSGKKIVAFDLCEIVPSDRDEWDANVGARLLFKLCCYARQTMIEN